MPEENAVRGAAAPSEEFFPFRPPRRHYSISAGAVQYLCKILAENGEISPDLSKKYGDWTIRAQPKSECNPVSRPSARAFAFPEKTRKKGAPNAPFFLSRLLFIRIFSVQRVHAVGKFARLVVLLHIARRARLFDLPFLIAGELGGHFHEDAQV